MAITKTVIYTNANLYPTGWYYTNGSWAAKTVAVAADRYALLSPAYMQVDVGNMSLTLLTQSTLDLSAEATWDTIVGTDYRTASNRSGKDFYVYAVQPTTGTLPTFKISASATVPTSTTTALYTASNTRKVGGFHCLCVAVGTISNHTLTGYLAGDILPQSVWDLNNRAESENEGMVYDPKISAWVDIYLFTGTGTTTTSVNNATMKVSTTQYEFVDYTALQKKRLLFDHEFTSIATGCNEGTNIDYELMTLDVAPGTAWVAGDTLTGVSSTKTCVIVTVLTTLTYTIKSRTGVFTLGEVITNGTYTADQGAAKPTFAYCSPLTTTGHKNSVAYVSTRRMISNIGCEDCAGVLYQWLNDSLTSADGSASWAWKDVTGSRGQVYSQGTYGYYKLLAGSYWAIGASCGSRSRCLSYWAWVSYSFVGSRALSSKRKRLKQRLNG